MMQNRSGGIWFPPLTWQATEWLGRREPHGKHGPPSCTSRRADNQAAAPTLKDSNRRCSAPMGRAAGTAAATNATTAFSADMLAVACIVTKEPVSVSMRMSSGCSASSTSTLARGVAAGLAEGCGAPTVEVGRLGSFGGAVMPLGGRACEAARVSIPHVEQGLSLREQQAREVRVWVS